MYRCLLYDKARRAGGFFKISLFLCVILRVIFEFQSPHVNRSILLPHQTPCKVARLAIATCPVQLLGWELKFGRKMCKRLGAFALEILTNLTNLVHSQCAFLVCAHLKQQRVSIVLQRARGVSLVMMSRFKVVRMNHIVHSYGIE